MDPRPTPPPPPRGIRRARGATVEPGRPARRRAGTNGRADRSAAGEHRRPPHTAGAASPAPARAPRGVAILAAALLLWPFAGWFWIPWLAGLVVLVLVALLRLDRLLRGWTWHLGGLAVVVGLMLVTSPWDWALAASLGVLLAGLVQLPWWRLAAIGAVLCLAAGGGVGRGPLPRGPGEGGAGSATQPGEHGLLGERSPDRVLPALLEGIGQGDVVGVCDLAEPARNRFVQVAGTADCASAGGIPRRAAARSLVRNLDAPVIGAGTAMTVDGCRTAVGVAGFGRLGAGGVLQVGAGPAAGAKLLHQRIRAVPCSLRGDSEQRFRYRRTGDLRGCDSSVQCTRCRRTVG